MKGTLRTTLFCLGCCCAVIVLGCGSKDSTPNGDSEGTDPKVDGGGSEGDDTESRETEIVLDTDTTCGGGDAQVNRDDCAAICESHDNQADCEAVSLPRVSEYWDHACLWYEGVETQIDENGNCSFGEVRNICGYAAWGDIRCGGNGVWCAEQQVIEMELGAAYFTDNEKTFVILHMCGPNTAGSISQCRWGGLAPDNVYLSDGVEQCECACRLES